MRLTLDMDVTLDDGYVCQIADIVIDPRSKSVTHAILSPRHRNHVSRLVPIGDIAHEDGVRVVVHCTREVFEEYPYVETTAFVEMAAAIPVEIEGDWEMGIERVIAQPYFGTEFGGAPFAESEDVEIEYDRIPKGGAEIRRHSFVSTSDDHAAGSVDGFVMDDNDVVTHVVLERGHLWGRRDIAIPIGSVKRIVSDRIYLSLTKDDVKALPHVPTVPRD